MSDQESNADALAFESPFDKYYLYNFHRPEWVDELQRRLCSADDAPHVLILGGDAAIGRKYFLSAAAFEATDHRHPTIYAPIDLDGYEPDHKSLAEFARYQLSKLLPHESDALQQILKRTTFNLKLAAPSIWLASVLSIIFSVNWSHQRVAKYLNDLAGPGLHAKDALGDLIRRLTEDANLILHVTDDPQLTLGFRRWLLDLARTNRRLFLALSCPSGGSVDLMGQPVDAIRFDFEPLDVAALRGIVDARFEPNSFPEALLDAPDSLLRGSSRSAGRQDEGPP